MRKRLLGCISGLLTGAGLALAQEPWPAGSTPAALPTQTTDAPRTPAMADQPGPVADPATGGPAPHDIVREAPIPAPGRFFLDAEYLYWFSRPTKLPPLIVQGSPASPAATPAVGQPGTTIVVGNQQIDAGARSGGRLRAGFWFDAEETCGLEASGFFLEPVSSHFAVVSDNTRPLGLSFQNASNVSLNTETSLLFAVPDVAVTAGLSNSGVSLVHTSTKFWGADINAALNVSGASWYRADALIGFRYLRLQEELSTTTSSTAFPDGSVEFQGNLEVAPASTLVSDSFLTANDFYGGQVGAHILLQHGNWFADFRGLLAAGVTHEQVTISGFTSLTTPTGTSTVPGGLLAQVTNIGHHTNNEFTIVPEGIVSVGCQLTSFMRAYVGYSAIYWRQGVVRPATEIDRQISSTVIPTQNPQPLGTEQRPAVQLQKVDFWAQGVQFGLEFAF